MLKEQANLFLISFRISDFVLIVLSVGLAVQSERLYHQKGVDLFDFRSFHPYLVPAVILIWEFLFNLFEKTFLFLRLTIIFFAVICFVSLLAKRWGLK